MSPPVPASADRLFLTCKANREEPGAAPDCIDIVNAAIGESRIQVIEALMELD
jgi:hypothetical protein